MVRDDAIADDTVASAVHEVRAHGGKKQFSLTTTTLHEPKKAPKAGEANHAGGCQTGVDRPIAGQAGDHGVPPELAEAVIVGRLNERFVVVLVSDVSETVRFSQIRDSFITNVSEQLLKPTQSLEELADALEHDSDNKAAIEGNTVKLRQSCARMEHMVSDLLLLIKAQEPILPTASNRINVMEQVKTVVGAYRDMAQRRGIDIEIDGDESLDINGEGEQIQAAVAKLLENAIAYSPDGKGITVSVKPNEDGTKVLLSVLDRGCGIAQKEQSRIFERFYRGGNQNGHSEEGIGLGLAIVKHVALTHHGSASVWSAPGQGSTFTLELPVARKLAAIAERWDTPYTARAASAGWCGSGPMLLPVISRLAEPPVGLFAKTAVVPPVEMLPNQHEHADHRAGGAHGLQSFDIDAEGQQNHADHQGDGP